MIYLLVVNSVLAFAAAYGFSLGRKVLRERSSTWVWRFSLAVVAVFAPHLLMNLAYGIYLMTAGQVGFGMVAVLYFFTPFALATWGNQFSDRVWILPLQAALLIGNGIVGLYLALCQIF